MRLRVRYCPALWFAAAALATGLAGCSPKQRMMPAPLAVRAAGPSTFSRVAPERRSPSVEVFYATNRARNGGTSSRARYGSTMGDELRLGSASVRFGPASWDWEELLQVTSAGGRPKITVTRVEELGVLGSGGTARLDTEFEGASLSADGLGVGASTAFASGIDRELDRCGHRDVYIYVPGFNLTFELGLRRMAEFSHYLGRDGVFITYAWPAHAHPFAYDIDRRRARRSVAGFREFLRFLAERTDAERIHLITSSAGAPVVSDTLALMHAEYAGQSPEEVRRITRIGEVIYAASDQDVGEFREMLLSGAAAIAEHITVYSSSVDMGLALTRRLGSGDVTIGRLPAHINEADSALLRERADLVTVVDVTGAMGPAGRGDFWAHRYWYLNPWVSSDLLGVLRHRFPPEQRALVPVGDGAMWGFPADYSDRLNERMAACGLLAGTEVAK
jgi:esterase/lipase superfamily enzyme